MKAATPCCTWTIGKTWNYYKTHPLARSEMRFTAPPSENMREDVFHAVFDNEAQGRPTMCYIDQFVQPTGFDAKWHST